jgi:6-pyruvoyl-tetrahydropterin synthase related domain
LLEEPRSISISNSALDNSSEQAAAQGVNPARFPMLLVAIAATAVIAPMLFLGQASGHDFQFHLASWIDAEGQWRAGILFPRWAEWANWGFGEPRFIFYPPASWMIGAGLGSILPWKVAPGAFIWLTLVLAGYAMWRFGREYLAPGQAAGAAVLYAVNPYHLVMVYYRSDFAELLASAIFPLLLWGTLRAIREGWRSLPKVALPFATIWLSNAPAAVLATYSVALVAFVFFVKQRSVRPLLVCGSGMAVGFGIAAFYILPAAWEQRWVQIDQILTDLLRPGQNFLFSHADNPEFLFFNWKVSAIAIAVILATSLSAVIVTRRRSAFPDAWVLLMTLGAAATLMMFPASILVWRWLPKLQFVQFPWRWLGPLDFVSAFFLTAALANAKRQWLCWTATFVLLFGLGAAIVNDAWWDSEDIPVLTSGIRTGHGYEGTDEYQPLGASRYDLPGVNADGDSVTGPPAPQLAVFSGTDPGSAVTTGARVAVERWDPNSKVLSSSSAAPIVVALRLLAFPAWQATLDGSPITIGDAPETGQMLISVPAGTHRVVVRLGRTWDRTLGAIISALFLLALLLFMFATRGRSIASKKLSSIA